MSNNIKLTYSRRVKYTHTHTHIYINSENLTKDNGFFISSLILLISSLHKSSKHI